MSTNRRRLLTVVAAALLLGWQVVLIPLLGIWNLLYCSLLLAIACLIYVRVRSIPAAVLVAVAASGLNFLTPVPNFLCVDGGRAHLCLSIFPSVLQQSRFGLPEALLVLSYFAAHLLLIYAWHQRDEMSATQTNQP